MSLERLPIADGIDPLRLLLLRLKTVRFGNKAKSSPSSIPARFASNRFTPEIVWSRPQRMLVQLQRFLILARDHERREEDDKLFFHFTSASTSDLADEVTFSGRKLKEKIQRRTTQNVKFFFVLFYIIREKAY